MGPPTQDPTAPGTKDAAAGGRLGPDTPDEQTPGAAFKDLSTRLDELKEYVSYYLSAKADGIKVTLRNVGIYAALGVVGLIAGGAFIVTLMVFLLRGIAGGLGELFGGRLWLGELVTAIVLLAILGAGTMFILNRLTKASRERTAKKYASRQQQQRARFGTDVNQRAGNPAR